MTTPRAALLGMLGATAVHCAVPRCPDATHATATTPEPTTAASVAPAAPDGGSNDATSKTASDDAGVGTADGSSPIADGGAIPGQGLSPEQVRAVVLASQGVFQSCYEIELTKDPNARGGITIAFQIWTDGRVARADVTSSSIGNPRVERCMVEAFKKLRFPVSNKQTGAAFPFIFKKR